MSLGLAVERLKSIHSSSSERRMTEDERIKMLYPDLLNAGGLLSAIRTALQGKHASIQINGFGTGLSYAHVQCEQLSAQIFIGIDERRFDFDLWHEGIVQAAGASADFDDVTLAVERWVLGIGAVESLTQEFPFIRRKERSTTG